MGTKAVTSTQVYSQPISCNYDTNTNLVNTINTQPTSMPVVISQAPIPIIQTYSSPPPIHSVPNSTTLQLLNPWQMQARVEQIIPHSDKLNPRLNLESEAAKIRNNINQFENVNLPQNKPVEFNQFKEEPITKNNLLNTPNVDFKNQDGSYDYKSMAMFFKGVASSGSTKASKPKGNYGKLDPPTFVEDPELPNCAYYKWKKLFLEFLQLFQPQLWLCQCKEIREHV